MRRDRRCFAHRGGRNRRRCNAYWPRHRPEREQRIRTAAVRTRATLQSALHCSPAAITREPQVARREGVMKGQTMVQLGQETGALLDKLGVDRRSEEQPSELQSLMRN